LHNLFGYPKRLRKIKKRLEKDIIEVCELCSILCAIFHQHDQKKKDVDRSFMEYQRSCRDFFLSICLGNLHEIITSIRKEKTSVLSHVVKRAFTRRIYQDTLYSSLRKNAHKEPWRISKRSVSIRKTDSSFPVLGIVSRGCCANTVIIMTLVQQRIQSLPFLSLSLSLSRFRALSL